jgi:hypothetical protein
MRLWFVDMDWIAWLLVDVRAPIEQGQGSAV